MAHLLVEHGEHVARVELGRDDFSIGRGTSNDLHFRNPWLSRVHAKIVPRAGTFFLVDAGSRNGTFLNGRPISGEQPLHDGDRIALGDILLRFTDATTASASAVRFDAGAPLPAESTVRINSEDLVFKSYREPETLLVPSAQGSLLPALTRAASVLISHHPIEKLLEIVIDLARDTVGGDRAVLLLRSADGELRAEAVRGYGGEEVRISSTLIHEVLDRRQAVLTMDAQQDVRFEDAESILCEGIRSIICVPLRNDTQIIGLLYLDHRMTGTAFTENDLRVTGLVANLAAVKIENTRLLEEQIVKQRMAEQLELGSRIQRRLLPSEDPQIEGYEIRGETRSCYEIGGDYYDFIQKADGKLAVAIADISGKGVGAAILMAVLQASLRSLVHTTSDPASLVEKLSGVLAESSPANKFATLFYAELDPRENVLEYANGGHNPPLLCTSEGTVHELAPTGPIVGLLDDASYTSRRVRLGPGDVLLLFTDGITELENTEHEEFGTDRLVRLVRGHTAVGGKALFAAIRDELEEFSASDEGLDDDATLVLLHRRGDPDQDLPR